MKITTKSKQIVALLLALSPLVAAADEGMWMTGPLAPATYERMRALGLQLAPDELYNPQGTALQGAVVMFGGFCSGVVVSPQGLVLTNHHCGFSSIHAHSTPEHDYVKHGFFAAHADEEWPVPGLYVSFPVRVECVTDSVLPLLTRRDSLGRERQIWGARRAAVLDSLQSVMEARVLAEDSTLRAELASYYGGNDFYLNVYRDYNDVRLVMAPPASAGKFGGDTDNWMWPRQTCDFSVFRIYTAPDGRPAAYDSANVPLRSPRYAPISLAGYRQGDFAMTMGFPGSTYRYLSSYGIKARREANNEAIISCRGLKQNLWHEAMVRDSVVRLKYDNKFANSSNYWKNSIGMNRCLKEQNVEADKRAYEERLQEWIDSDEAARRKYGRLTDTLRLAYEAYEPVQRDYVLCRETFLNAVDLFSLARQLGRVGSLRDAGRRQALLTAVRRFYRDFDAALDCRTLAAMLRHYLDEARPEHLPSLYADVAERWGGSFSAFADDLYRRSVLTDSARLLSLIERGKTARIQRDPAVRLVARTMHELAPLLAAGAANPTREPERRLQQALHEMYARSAFYPDANFTIRLSYGTVRPYTPPLGEPYPMFTTAQSLWQKVQRAEQTPDYSMEPALARLLKDGPYGRYADRSSQTLQLCFITDNDITGGNSGSPVFNSRGELMGLAFDGNWESMANDLRYSPELTRCINVDIRYVLFVMEHWTHAQRLIDEMSLRP